MTAFEARFTKQKSKLAQLNRCRIWLHPTTISNITDASGNQLCLYALIGEPHPHRTTTYKWRNQITMHGKYWKIWTKALKVTFTTDGLTLRTPLGDWFPNINVSQNWTTYRDIDTDTLYMSPHYATKTWTAHKPVSANGRTLIYNHKPREPCSPPKKGVKISLQSQTQYTLIFTNSCTIPVNLRSTHIH